MNRISNTEAQTLTTGAAYTGTFPFSVALRGLDGWAREGLADNLDAAGYVVEITRNRGFGYAQHGNPPSVRSVVVTRKRAPLAA